MRQLAGLCLVIMARVSPFYLFIRAFSPTIFFINFYPVALLKLSPVRLLGTKAYGPSLFFRK